ncbi:MAG: protein kinase [Candidatus Promineifilaceae bacterium]|nr:protein kinase [Candidatus Promineifilaceae bacterium]
MENLTGQSLKAYELLERIGSGGFGAVYRAYQSTIGREVAVKVILPHFANQPDFIRRFEAEAQLIARLEHLHIVPLYDYWREPDGAYLVMRWLRGGSAKDALERSPFSLESTALLLDQVSAALSVAHAGDVVHRDLKPSNILLDEEGNAYLADFGIAVDLRRRGGSGGEEGATMGSPAYLAPEQARGEAVSPRTDIYSLGVTLYECLTGAHPFRGLNAVELLYKQINDPLPELTAVSEDVRPEIDAVIRRATAKDPRQRYDDALSLAAAFRRAARLKGREAEEAVEMLTPREQDILRLIGAGLTNRRIAQELYVEHSTVRWYIRQIYNKLDVRSRRQAIKRAREMQLAEAPKGAANAETSTSISVALPAPANPFKGLRAFTAADRGDFYGREALLARLLESLQLPPPSRALSAPEDSGRFLAVVGPSGSGKSSLVRAGLIPALWEGQLPGSERWFVAEFTPGDRPLDELGVALLRVAADQAGNLRQQLLRDASGLLRAAKLILPRDDSELVLVIDQFEELFSLVEDETERAFFLDLLATAVTAPRSRVRVVLTLRADYYDRPLHYPEFGRLVRRHMETVLPLRAEELEQAIVRPPEAVGVTYERGLVATMIDDVLYQPGALPLLQYALTELFEERDERTLTHEAYTAIGGATGALAKRAEELYREQDTGGRELVRQVFLRLVSVGREEEAPADTRRRVPRAELQDLSTDDDLLDEIVDLFAAYRLLTLDHDPASRRPTVEVAHEALLREWERLREWLNESRAEIRWQRQLARAAEEWENAGRDASFLIPGGTRLEQFETWAQTTELVLTQRESAFLQASLEAEAQRTEQQAQQARARRDLRRALIGALSLGLILAIGLSIFAFSRQRAAEASEQEALRQISVGLAAQALGELDGDAPERGVLLALEALEKYPYSPQAESALAQAVYGTHPYTTLRAVSGFMQSIAFSPDGALIAAGDSVWGSVSGEMVTEFNTANSGVYNLSLDWLSDNRGVLAVRPELGGMVIIQDAATGEERSRHRFEAVNTAYASADGRLALSASSDGTAYIWRMESGEIVQNFVGHEGSVYDAVWSPDERRVATAAGDGTIRIWDAQSGAEQKRIDAHPDGVRALSWSSGGERLASAGNDGLGRVWDTATGELLFTLIGHDAVVHDIEWSPDDSLLATGGGDGMVRVWDGRAGAAQFTLPGSDSTTSDVSWSPDGQRLAVSGEALPRIWNVTTPIVRLVGYSAIDDSADAIPAREIGIRTANPYWSADSSWVGASGISDHTYRLWDPLAGENIRTFMGVGDGIGYPNPAGTEIILGNPLRILNLETGQERRFPLSTVWSTTSFFEWSPDGRLINVQPGRLSEYRIYDAETLELLYRGKRRACGHLLPGTFSPDGAYLAHTCLLSDKVTAARIVETMTGRVVQELEGHTDWTFDARWSPDGTKLASTSNDLTVRVWDVASGATLTVFSGHTVSPLGLDWSPDGTRLVSGDAAGTVLVWDAETGGIVNRYNLGGYTQVNWSPDGSRVLTTGHFPAPDIRPVWQFTEELIEYAYECCVFRELTPEEREQFGLPLADEARTSSVP